MRQVTTDKKTEQNLVKPEVLVLAPTGIDARLICQTLTLAGLNARACVTIDELAARIGDDTGVVVVSEEALRADTAGVLAGALHRQPSWSDIPFVVLVAPLGIQFEGRMAEIRRMLGNVTLLERPIRPYSLLAAADVGLRTRARQYEIRDHLREREEAARALRQSEQRYRSLVEASASVVWIADKNGRLMPNDNERWCAFTGQTAGAADLLSAIHEADRHDFARDWWQAINERQIFQTECRALRASGQYCTVLIKAVPVFQTDGDVREWVGTCTDIEQQRRAEDALRHSERLAVAGRMAASIAHEINNPLEAVTNLLYLIRTTEDAHTRESYVDIAQGELRRVIDVVAQTLSYYRQSSTPSEHSLAELVDSVLVLLGARLRSRSITVERRYEPAPKLLCYPGELKQVFANLLTNAIDAMGESGRLVVSVKNITGHNGRRDCVRVTIADTGIGIPKSVQANLFQPFFSTKGNRGTGLGLWITSALLRKHHAKLKIRSRTGAGATGTVMSIVFPSTMPEAENGQGNETGKVQEITERAPAYLRNAAQSPSDRENQLHLLEHAKAS